VYANASYTAEAQGYKSKDPSRHCPSPNGLRRQHETFGLLDASPRLDPTAPVRVLFLPTPAALSSISRSQLSFPVRSTYPDMPSQQSVPQHPNPSSSSSLPDYLQSNDVHCWSTSPLQTDPRIVRVPGITHAFASHRSVEPYRHPPTAEECGLRHVHDQLECVVPPDGEATEVTTNEGELCVSAVLVDAVRVRGGVVPDFASTPVQSS
jgi:hypothetical protein